MPALDTLQQAVMVLVPMILSLTVHEYAHARSAFALGDDTASRVGRMNLNPMSHIDVFGTILLPLLSIVSGSGFFFGWAKPVPINPVQFTRKVRMKTGVLLTAAAGPLSNLLFALLIAVGFRAVVGLNLPEAVLTLMIMTFKINVVLAVFNLIPVPPLDGSRVLAGLLPDSLGRRFAVLERNPMFVILAFAALIGFAGRLMSGLIDFVTRMLLMVTGNL